MNSLMDLLQAIDTYELGHVVDRKAMQYVKAKDTEGLSNYFGEDTLFLNTLINRHLVQVCLKPNGQNVEQIIVIEIAPLSFLMEDPEKDLRMPSYLQEVCQPFDADAFAKYLQHLAHNHLYYMINPNYSALRVFVNQYPVFETCYDDPPMDYDLFKLEDDVVNAWCEIEPAVQEMLPKKYNVMDDFFLDLLKLEVAGMASGNLIEDGVQFELEGEKFVLGLNLRGQLFEMARVLD